MRKSKFADGGEVVPEEDTGMGAAGSGQIGLSMNTPDVPMPSFKEAFAAARRSGEKEFEWNGKKFNTQLAGPKVKPMAPSRPAPPVAGRPRGGDIPSAAKAGLVDKLRQAFGAPSRGFAGGGMVGGRGDGCAIKGRTKGTVR